MVLSKFEVSYVFLSFFLSSEDIKCNYIFENEWNSLLKRSGFRKLLRRVIEYEMAEEDGAQGPNSGSKIGTSAGYLPSSLEAPGNS